MMERRRLYVEHVGQGKIQEVEQLLQRLDNEQQLTLQMLHRFILRHVWMGQ